MLQALAQRMAPQDRHWELIAHIDAYPDQLMALRALAVSVVFGHLGYLTIGCWLLESTQRPKVLVDSPTVFFDFTD
jgi:hypothetical protein